MTNARKNRPFYVILLFFQGMLIGVSGILPGISGGVLCVAFGIYKPFMELLASPLRGIRAHWRMLLPVGLGALIGFSVLVKAVSDLLTNYESLATAAFAGLVLGTVPSLLRTAGQQKRGGGSYVAFFVSFALFLSLFLCLKNFDGITVSPTFFWLAFAGCLWGISIVLPGISSSAILIFLGLFTPIAEGAMAFDMSVILPLAIGGAASIILLSKLVNSLYRKHFSVMSHIILGVVIATVIPILPFTFSSIGDALVKILLVAVGFGAATVFDIISTFVLK